MHPKTPSTIHINPNFRKIHINPMFLSKTALAVPNQRPPSSASPAGVPLSAAPPKATNIYINPRFLNESHMLAGIAMPSAASNAIASDSDYSMHASDAETTDEEPQMVFAHIQPQINRKLVRTPALVASTRTVKPADKRRSNLMKIGSRKLIRAPSARPRPQPIAKAKVIRKPVQTKYKIVKEHSTYKIDRRSAHAKLSVMPLTRLSLGREHVQQRRLSKTRNDQANQSQPPNAAKPFANRKLALISINGIVYRSTQTKLQKTTASTASASGRTSVIPQASTELQSHRTLYVRGERFLLDPNGQCLLRSSTSGRSAHRTAATNVGDRIYIGGLTYVRSATNTYELTDSHKNRYHLNLAKQRSISLLSQKRTKMNVPCPIYRRLGKCAAFTRSKCAKLHDPKLVDVCPKFLKGDCDKSACLLYHEITLAKMPTCRYYLKGLCAKTECPYLHKKVNENTSICTDFLRGYCPLAGQCLKRHDLLCPEIQRNGECKVTRCPYPHPRRRKAKIDKRDKRKDGLLPPIGGEEHTASQPKKTAAAAAGPSTHVPRITQRYFVEDRDGASHFEPINVAEARKPDAAGELSAEGKATLSRVLSKIEQMKVNYLLGTDSTPVASASDMGQAMTSGEDGADVAGRRKRPKLGPLPSYIPFE